jgi:hypothetical protein
MKIRRNVYTILIVFLFLIQQIISGCSTTVTKSLQKDDLRKIEVDLISQNLFKNKCTLCHELPEIEDYSAEEWTGIIDYTHDTNEVRKFITLEEAEKINGYLKSIS